MDNSEQLNLHIHILAEAIRRWCCGTASLRSELLLTRTAATIARRTLGRRLYLCAEKHGCSAESAALQAVSPLFSPKGAESLLARSLQEKLDVDDLALVQMFEDLVRWTARQSLYHLGLSVTPIRANLDRYLRILIREHPPCEIKTAWGRTWVMFDAKGDYNWEAPPWGYAELLLVLNAGAGATSTKGLFEFLVKEIRKFPDRSPVAAFGDILDAFAQLGATLVSEEELDVHGCRELDPLLRLAVERSLEEMQRHVETLTCSYERAGKMTPAEAAGICRAIDDLAQEWLNSGFSREHFGLFGYLKIHLPALDELDFGERLAAIFWRIQFEARNTLLSSLRRNYGDKLGK